MPKAWGCRQKEGGVRPYHAALCASPRVVNVDLLILVKAAIMGVVEGLTEFLPISSTGHLILTASLLNFTGETVKVFDIAIQSGAMLAVIWEYRRKLAHTITGVGHDPVARRFLLNVLIAFIPAAVLGLLFGKWVKEHLFHPVPVAMAFVVGGFIILWVEARHRRLYGAVDTQGTRRARVESVDDMTPMDALKVGLFQCVALIPGTSRSGATIIGSILLGFSRKAATEFSFFLGIPTLMGAGAYSLLKNRDLLRVEDIPMFAVGTVVSFFSALVCIRWLIRYVSTHDFVPFAWYRIIFGGIVLLTAYTGWVTWAA
jgi:undecaprenyl-diphosphatase